MGLNLTLFSLLKKRKKQRLGNEPMLIQIAILAWIFLGEGITLQEIIGMAVAAVGAVLVQLMRRMAR